MSEPINSKKHVVTLEHGYILLQNSSRSQGYAVLELLLWYLAIDGLRFVDVRFFSEDVHVQ